MLYVENAKRLLMGIISESDSISPFYNELSTIMGIPYTETKKRLKTDVSDYLNKLHDLRKRFYMEKKSFDSFLREDDTAMEALSYILKVYGKNDCFSRILHITNEI